jgi:hypothetical protein
VNSAPAALQLDRYQQAQLDLWRSAAVELCIGPESVDPLVQTGVETVLSCLRAQVATPALLLGLYAQPHGPLASHLRLVSSLLDSEDAGDLPTRVCWWVVKTAFYRRWLELTVESTWASEQ